MKGYAVQSRLSLCTASFGEKMQETESIRNIKGIGEKTEGYFRKLQVTTVGELLSFYPRSYDQYTQIVPVRSVKEGEMVVLEGRLETRPAMSRVRNLTIITASLKDATGSIRLRWFNMPYLMKLLKLGKYYILRGKVTVKNGIFQITQPKILTKEEYLKNLGRMLPIYPLTTGLSNTTVTKAVKEVLKVYEFPEDYLPLTLRKQYGLLLLKKALQQIHFPDNTDSFYEARKRIVFDEFFLFSLALQQLKENKHMQPSEYLLENQDMPNTLIGTLPFELTDGQRSAWEDIRADLTSGYVMNRLIQGDVGSGKTIVALLALLCAVENGHQGAIMVPTEVLAGQHYEEFKERLKAFDIRVVLLCGSMRAAEKKKVKEEIHNGTADIVVGTHTLIQEGVDFKDLALIVTDEQHRFGVNQRERFTKKGSFPHVLVMSATPIPRTLAMIFYGDLDVSVIQGLPKNRLPIKNYAVGTNERPQAYQSIAGQVREGHQAYIICPMVEDSENVEAENVIDYTASMKELYPPSIRVECLHGRMKPAKKNEIMEHFTRGEIDVLVSTTVIEVGINVPNATVMMIENAERFGLAQLHQLRGRVGRGEAQSYCIFMAGNSSKETMERLEIMENSNDGFYIAEEDLKLRGPGDIFGIRQSGELFFKMADIYQDADILQAASEAAKEFSKNDVLILCKKYAALREKLEGYTGEVFL